MVFKNCARKKTSIPDGRVAGRTARYNPPMLINIKTNEKIHPPSMIMLSSRVFRSVPPKHNRINDCNPRSGGKRTKENTQFVSGMLFSETSAKSTTMKYQYTVLVNA